MTPALHLAKPCCRRPLPVLCCAVQVHVLNGEKYREVCPENTLLNSMQLRSCIILPHNKKPLLKRESALGVADDTRIYLPVEVRAHGAHDALWVTLLHCLCNLVSQKALQPSSGMRSAFLRPSCEVVMCKGCCAHPAACSCHVCMLAWHCRSDCTFTACRSVSPPQSVTQHGFVLCRAVLCQHTCAVVCCATGWAGAPVRPAVHHQQ